jgi:hypothetical protein
MFEIPITKHHKLPEGVPLVADFSDMRNRLSYYLPVLRAIDDVNVPITKFFPIEGDYDSYPEIEYRDITTFMQDQKMRQAFVRGDYSSGKFDGDSGSRITSQDAFDIEGVVIEMMRQLARSKRHLGGRIAVREWIPPAREVRFFLRDGEIQYADSVDDDRESEWPWDTANTIAQQMDTYAWSCDFIEHEKTGMWYCIDMGLDGLYYSEKHGWVPHSGHHDESQSPERFVDGMPRPEVLSR